MKHYLRVFLLIIVVIALSVQKSCGFRVRSAARNFAGSGVASLNMKWSFSSKGSGPMGMAPSGTMREMNLIGSEGEIYFHPQKEASIRGPRNELIKGKELVVPIFPHNNVITPQSTDWLNIHEMKHRQIIDEIGTDGVFGYSHYSQSNQKLALVGCLVKVKKRNFMPDGRSFVIIEGVKRFFIKQFVGEHPYIKARVQMFDDFTENENELDMLERKVFNEVRANVKVRCITY